MTTLSLPPELGAELDELNAKLTPLQRRFLIAMATSKYPAEAARRVGMSRDSVWAWRGRSPAFKRSLELVLAGAPLRRVLELQLEQGVLPQAVEFVGNLLAKPLELMSGKEITAAERAASGALRGRGLYRSEVEGQQVVRFELPPCLKPAGPAVIEGQFTELEESD